MDTRANYVLIGSFTLAVLAAAFLFVYWFSGGDRGQKRQPVRIVFSGSVAGLSKGSVVTFNGIRVGEVGDIRLLPEDPRRVVAVVEVDRETPIRSDTRARLDVSLLSNVGQIALVGGEPGSPSLQAGPGQPLPTIFADRADLADLIESARNIARRADEVLERVNKLVADNEGGVGRTVQNVERFSQTLADKSPLIDTFLTQVGQAAERIGPLAGKLEVLTDDVTVLVRAIEPQRVSRTVENVESFTETLAANRDQVTTILRDFGSLARSLNDSAGKLDGTLNDVSTLVRAVDAGQINRAVGNVEAFTKTLADNRGSVETILRDVQGITQAIDPAKVSGTLANVEAFSQTLVGTRDPINAILRDAGTLAQRLNESAGKLDTTLGDVSTLVRAVDAGKINSAVGNIDLFSKTLADNRGSVETILRDVQGITRSVDPAKVSTTLANVESFSQTLADNRENVGAVLRDVSSLARRLNESAPKLDTALTEVANLAKAIDATKINRVVENADKFAASLGKSAPDVEKAITEARSLAEKLNKSADRVDGVLKAAEQFLGTAAGPEGESTFGEIRQAARSFRILADNLDKRTAEITAGVTRFTNTGLRDVGNFAREGARTATEIGRTARSLEKNPQQLLFGGRPNLPEYNGRR